LIARTAASAGQVGQWQRLGRLALDTSAASWAVSHAALPVVSPIDPGLFEVLLSLRDTDGRARIGRTVLTMRPQPALAALQSDPVLDLGVLGAFDDSGVTTSCLVRSQGRRLLYYTGWSRGVTVPFYLSAGLAVSDGGPFERVSAAPLFDRTRTDPFLTASPCVMVERDRWRMWYVSATEWRHSSDGPWHYYNIRYAESQDGIEWTRSGIVCLDYASASEHAFARPSVVRDEDRYRMWFAVRGERYHIGYASSLDGVHWTRADGESGLTPDGHDWESEMVEYPYVFDWAGRRYMLYNGNGYGRTGVGLAVQE
jgi:hypothetical protein